MAIEQELIEILPKELDEIMVSLPYSKLLINDALATLLKTEKIYIDPETKWVKAIV